MRRTRILLLYRRRESYWGVDPNCADSLSSGLQNSILFLEDALLGLGLHVKAVEVIDNNAIDREVTLYQPTQVIIEALWCVDTKIDVLKRLHPEIHWSVR